MIQSRRFLFICILLVLLIVGCGGDSHSKKSGGDETTNGMTALILGKDGKPVQSARVSVYEKNFLYTPGVSGTQSAKVHLELVTDEQGLVRIDSLPPGDYRIVTIAGANSTSWIQTSPWSTHLDTMVLEPSSVLKGVVPLPAASGPVYLTAQGSDFWCLAKEDGSFEFSGLPAGKWVITSITLQQGIVYAQDTVDLEATGDTLEDVKLEPLPPEQMEWSDSADILVNTKLLGLSSALDSFPLYLDLSDSLYPIGLSGSASDLRVQDRNGKSVPFEVVLWVPAEHRLRIAFLAKSIPASDSVLIGKIKWGNPGAVAVSTIGSVFDSSLGWSGIWHLVQWKLDLQGKLRAPASVPGSEDGVVQGALNASAQGVWFDGSDQYVSIPPIALDLSTQDWTIDFWIRPEAEGIMILNRSAGKDAWNHRQKAIYLGAPDSSAGLEVGLYPAMIGAQNQNGYSFASTALTLNDYQHVAIRRTIQTGDSGKIEWFINGTPVPSAYPDSLTIWDGDGALDSLYIGGKILGRGMQGWVREFGISQVARSDDWIRLRYFSTKILSSNWIVRPINRSSSATEN